MKEYIKKFRVFILLFVLLLGLFLSLSQVRQMQDNRQRAQTAPIPAPVTITIQASQFSQSTVTIPVGTTVTWNNQDTAQVPHTTTSDNLGTADSWDSPVLGFGNSFSKTFSTPGVYTYYCKYHPGMTGTIIVTEAPTAVPTSVLSPTTIPSPTPDFVCLGACATDSPPTEIPTPTALLATTVPTAIPTDEPTPTSTPVTATPTPTAALPTLEPTAVPCTDSTVATQSNSNHIHTANVTQNKGVLQSLLEFILQLIQLLLGFFGISLPGPYIPSPTPTSMPTEMVMPTTYITATVTAPIFPTAATTPGAVTTPVPTNLPGVTVFPTPFISAIPTLPIFPTATHTPGVITPVPTNLPSGVPTRTPTVIPTATATVAPTPPCNVTPGISATPTPDGKRSVDDFHYVLGNEPLKTFDLKAEVMGDKWVFNGMLPGPELHATQGDHIRVNFLNALPESMTIHWHGVRVPASQDGVAGVTQNAVKPGASFIYDFVVPDSGTFWYHPHQNTSESLPKGLFGSLIIAPKQEGVHYDRDYSIVYRDTNPETKRFEANPGERIRVRLLNSRIGDSIGSPVIIAPVGVPFKVIALDGHDINGPQEIKEQLLPIGMGQRYDLEFIMPASGGVQLADFDRMQTIQFGQDDVINPPNLNTLPQFDFTEYGLPTSDSRLVRSTFDAEHTLTIGSNMTINGELGHNIPDMIVKEGQQVLIHYANNSNMYHPMHLHGHIMSVLKKNGKELTGSPIHLDSILLAPGESADVAFLADNPGIWMLHCHILSHAAAGLTMMVNYDNVYTPYKIGPESGNIPE